MIRKLKKQINSFFKNHWPIIAIVTVGAFFRFYNAVGRYSLGDETLRDAFVGIVGAEQLQFPLTGPFSSLGPFTFGPWYWYFLIIGNLLIPSNYASWIVLGLFSTATILIYYLIGIQLKNRQLGIIISSIVALSWSHNIAAIHLTNPNMINFFVALSLYLFIKGVKQYNPWVIFGMSLTLGIGANIHYQMFGLFLFPIILALVHFRHFIKIVLISASGIVIAFLPLLFFDMNNHWYTVGNMWYFLRFGKEALYIPYRWLFYLRDFWPSFWADVYGIPIVLAYGMIVSVSIYVLYSLYKRKFSKTVLLLGIIFLIEFVRLRYHWGERFFGYLHYLHPFIFIFTGLMFSSIITNKKIRIIALGLGIIFIGILFYRRFSIIQTDYYVNLFTSIASDLENKYPGEKISIYTCENQQNYVYSVVFLLDREGILADGKGKKLGFIGPECSFYPQVPEGHRTPQIEKIIQMSKYADAYTVVSKDYELVEFSELGQKEIEEEGLKLVTPEIIFEDTTRWWFDEQP